MQMCMGIRCDGFEEQFIALLAAIEVGQHQANSSLGDTTAKKRARELKSLKWSVKDGMAERSSNWGKFKGQASKVDS